MLDNQSPLVGAIELSQKTELTGSPVAKPELAPLMSQALDLVIDFQPELEDIAIILLDDEPFIRASNLHETDTLSSRKSYILDTLTRFARNSYIEENAEEMKNLISPDEVTRAVQAGKDQALQQLDGVLLRFQRARFSEITEAAKHW